MRDNFGDCLSLAKWIAVKTKTSLTKKMKIKNKKIKSFCSRRGTFVKRGDRNEDNTITSKWR
jgi:hypothetical protein